MKGRIKLWLQWSLLVLGWGLSTISAKMWPQVDGLDLKKTSDLFWAIVFNPLQYILSLLFLVFVILLLSSILKKIIYECKVSFLFKKIPYESVFLFVFSFLIFTQTFLSFPLITLTLAGIVFTYEIISYVVNR